MEISRDIPHVDQIVQAIQKLFKLGHDTTIGNIAEELGLSDADAHEWMAEALRDDKVLYGDLSRDHLRSGYYPTMR